MAVLSSRVRFCSIGMVPSSGRSACLMVLTGKELHCICTEKCSAGQRFALQEFVCELCDVFSSQVPLRCSPADGKGRDHFPCVGGRARDGRAQVGECIAGSFFVLQHTLKTCLPACLPACKTACPVLDASTSQLVVLHSRRFQVIVAAVHYRKPECLHFVASLPISCLLEWFLLSYRLPWCNLQGPQTKSSCCSLSFSPLSKMFMCLFWPPLRLVSLPTRWASSGSLCWRWCGCKPCTTSAGGGPPSSRASWSWTP